MTPATQAPADASAALKGGGRPSAARPLALIAILMAAAIGVQVVRDRGWTPYQPPSSVLWLRSGDMAKRLALGFDDIAADVYWIRAVIYYGGRRQSTTTRNYDLLYPLLDLVTALDPHFKAAYRFGALFLSEPPPGGPGRTDHAIALLERAIEEDGDWEYFEDIGFVHYWWRSDYATAAEWFKRGGERPGAPNWLIGLAATTLATGGSRESSRQLWTQLLSDVDAGYIKTQAQHRLRQLDAMDAIDQLTIALQRFTTREGRMPKSWQELVAAERLPGVPLDPTGVPYVVNPASGRIDVSRQSTLWPLPTESGKVAK
jgi:hypothetical protein